jgi:hypothetical protein
MKKTLFENVGGNQFRLIKEIMDIPGLDAPKYYIMGKIIGYADKSINITRNFSEKFPEVQRGYDDAMKTPDPEFETKWSRAINNVSLHSNHLRNAGSQSGLHSKI